MLKHKIFKYGRNSIINSAESARIIANTWKKNNEKNYEFREIYMKNAIAFEYRKRKKF